LKFRVKFVCPACRQERNALYDGRSPETITPYTHRRQATLEPGEKPARCRVDGRRRLRIRLDATPRAGQVQTLADVDVERAAA